MTRMTSGGLFAILAGVALSGAQISDSYRQAAATWRAAAAAKSGADRSCALAQANYYDCLATQVSGRSDISCKDPGCELSGKSAPAPGAGTSPTVTPTPSSTRKPPSTRKSGVDGVREAYNELMRRDEEEKREAERRGDELSGEAARRSESNEAEWERRRATRPPPLPQDAGKLADPLAGLDDVLLGGSRVDCNALRATYRNSPTTLPDECLTDLDRATTYQPGSRPTPRAPEPEPVIDGSKIPSRIDFTKPATTPSPAANPSPGSTKSSPSGSGGDQSVNSDSRPLAPVVQPSPEPSHGYPVVGVIPNPNLEPLEKRFKRMLDTLPVSEPEPATISQQVRTFVDRMKKRIDDRLFGGLDR